MDIAHLVYSDSSPATYIKTPSMQIEDLVHSEESSVQLVHKQRKHDGITGTAETSIASQQLSIEHGVH